MSLGFLTAALMLMTDHDRRKLEDIIDGKDETKENRCMACAGGFHEDCWEDTAEFLHEGKTIVMPCECTNNWCVENNKQ
jgi:hypothetical protein